MYPFCVHGILSYIFACGLPNIRFPKLQEKVDKGHIELLVEEGVAVLALKGLVHIHQLKNLACQFTIQCIQLIRRQERLRKTYN